MQEYDDDDVHGLDIEKASDITQHPGLFCKLQKEKVKDTETYQF
jgi:hypothetical protein